MNDSYDKDDISALAAITEAQKIAFAPMLFQAALNLRDLGILAFLDEKGKQGATRAAIASHCALGDYATGVLVDMGLSGRILYRRDQHYILGKIGHFLLHDPMTVVNMDFTQHVCWQALYYLRQSLEQGKPAGLQVFGDWPTLYPALSQLPAAAQRSWFAFDHFYSDAAFNAVLPQVFALGPRHLYDLGGNTGKWALRCCEYDEKVRVTVLDLPQQIALAVENIARHGMAHRINTQDIDLLSDIPLPGAADVWWMSQFLDCFSEVQIVSILKKIAAVMKPSARICILELFWDRQPHEAGAFSLNAASLYFTCMANGNSRFYGAQDFLRCLAQAGFIVEQQTDGIGICHTLLICKKASAGEPE